MDNTPLEDFLKGNDEREQIQEILKQNKLFTIGDVLKDNVNINNVNIEERIRGEYKWSNWNMNQTCTPKKHYQPTTQEEVVSIIKEAKGVKSIRAAGLGHSWSPLIPTDELLILSSGLKKITVDEVNKIATCQAGVSIKEFEDELNKKHLTMNTNVVLEDVYMIGVVESMCHGPGYAYSLVADNVIAITLVNYQGEVLKINEKDHPEDMKALRGALGTMGFVVDMTFRVIPLDTLEMRDETLSVQKYFLDKGEDLKNVIEKYNGWVELFWVPFNDLFWMKSWKESSAPATNPNHTISDKMGSIFQKLIYALPMPKPHDPFIGPLTKGFLKFIFSLMTTGFPATHYWNRRHSLHWREFIHDFQVEDTEFAILVDPEYKNVKFAFQVIRDTIEKFASKGNFPVDITVEIRFGKGSDTLLAPTNGSADQKWCFIEFLRSGLHSKPQWLQESWQNFVDEVCLKWIANENLKARVHWAKGYHKIPGIEKTIRKSFSDENWNKFKAVRDKYDPNHVFSNSYLENLLGQA